MSRPHLLFVVTEDWYFVSHRLALATAADRAGYRVSVATRVRDHGAEIKAAGIHPISWTHRRGSLNPFRKLASLAALVRIYRRERPDIVHHVALEPTLLGGVAARMTKVPRVINAVAGMGWLYSSSDGVAASLRPLVRQSLARLFRHPSMLAVVQNPDDERVLAQLGVPASRLELVPGVGIDLSRYAATAEPDDGVPVVVLPARLLKDKGVQEFVEAVRLLRARGVRFRAVLAGSPDPHNPSSISALTVAAWVREGSVEHLGWVRDMPSVLAASHIVCLPSYREGLPKALLEASAAGRPIVTTDVPGCRAAVRNGENGLLVPARDAVALSHALHQLISDRPLRIAMGRRGRERAEREWAESVVIQQMLDFHAKVVP